MRLSLLSVVMLSGIVLIMPPEISAGTAKTAEFVSGSEKSIPANTLGSLDSQTIPPNCVSTMDKLSLRSPTRRSPVPKSSSRTGVICGR